MSATGEPHEEVVAVDVGGRPIVFAWDGRVLEIFGFALAKDAASERFHVATLELELEGPDRRGRHQVRPRLAGRHSGADYTFDAAEMERLQALLERVRAAATAAAPARRSLGG